MRQHPILFVLLLIICIVGGIVALNRPKDAEPLDPVPTVDNSSDGLPFAAFWIARGPATFGTFIHCWCDGKPLGVVIWIAMPDYQGKTYDELIGMCPARIAVGKVEYMKAYIPKQRFHPRHTIVYYTPVTR